MNKSAPSQGESIRPDGTITRRERLAALLVMAAMSSLTTSAVLAHDDDFRLSSTTFKNGATLPISLVDNFISNGVNVCTADGSAGGNTSPELSWEDAPRGTRSFAIVMFDETASFTHWGIFNISPSTRFLPTGAGAANSVHGSQIHNDFGSLGYEGPCPPAGVAPDLTESRRAARRGGKVTLAARDNQLFRNASRSAFTLSFSVEHMPWGAPG